jgi:hypothetical protein
MMLFNTNPQQPQQSQQSQPPAPSANSGGSGGMMGATTRPKPRFIDQMFMRRRDEQAKGLSALLGVAGGEMAGTPSPLGIAGGPSMNPAMLLGR